MMNSSSDTTAGIVSASTPAATSTSTSVMPPTEPNSEIPRVESAMTTSTGSAPLSELPVLQALLDVSQKIDGGIQIIESVHQQGDVNEATNLMANLIKNTQSAMYDTIQPQIRKLASENQSLKEKISLLEADQKTVPHDINKYITENAELRRQVSQMDADRKALEVQNVQGLLGLMYEYTEKHPELRGTFEDVREACDTAEKQGKHLDINQVLRNGLPIAVSASALTRTLRHGYPVTRNLPPTTLPQPQPPRVTTALTPVCPTTTSIRASTLFKNPSTVQQSPTTLWNSHATAVQPPENIRVSKRPIKSLFGGPVGGNDPVQERASKMPCNDTQQAKVIEVPKALRGIF